MTRSKLHHRLAAALGLGATGTGAESPAALRDDPSGQAGPRALTIDQVESVLAPDRTELGDAPPSARLADLGVVELAERLVQALHRRDARLDAETTPALVAVEPAGVDDDADEDDFAFAPLAGATEPARLLLMPIASPTPETAPAGPLVIFPSQMVSAAARPLASGGGAAVPIRPAPGATAATEALEAALARLLHTNGHD